MPRKKINGILIEGANYSGKSSVIALLAAKLAGRGDLVIKHKCFLCPDILNEQLENIAFQKLGQPEGREFPDAGFMRHFNTYKSANICIDSYLAFRSEPLGSNAVVHIQDRHWFSQYCNNEFFTPGEGLLSSQWIRSSSPEFTLHVYLSCNAINRKRRASSRIKDSKSKLHRYFDSHLDKMPFFEKFCRSLIPKHHSWVTISTDDKTAENVANQILALYVKALQSTKKKPIEKILNIVD